MNDKKICFILCSNQELYLNECLFWIGRLEVPEGYEVERQIITDARSMTEGYNRAMRRSDAKYKVYLHQDTFIFNPHFLTDMLAVFAKDAGIGMMGMIGVEKMPENGVMWQSNQRVGMLYEHRNYQILRLQEKKMPEEAEYMPVEAIDGFMMVTQYDLPWREELFDRWDFYDASQSMEFIRAGYQVVVPGMKEPWCLHDCGIINLEHYEQERVKYVQEYLS